MSKRLFALLLSALFLVLSFGGHALAATKTSQSSDITLTIVHTNDVHSHVDIEPYVKAYVQELRDAGKNVILISAGDAFAGTPFASLSQGQDVATVMNDVGYELFVLGNWEQSMKLDELQAVVDRLEFPVLGKANLYGDLKKELDGVDGFIIKQYGGVKVAFLGITWAAYTEDDVGVVGDYTVKRLESLRKQAKRKGAKVFIAVTHVGVTDPDETNRSTYLAEKAPWLTAIIDAHCHTLHENGLLQNNVLIAETGEYGNNIGVVEITFNKKGKVLEKSARVIPIKGHEEECGIEPDAKLSEIIAEIRSENDAYLQTVVAKVPFNLDGERATTRTTETNLGNLLCDAVLLKTGADVTFTSSPYIRMSVAKGNLTNETLISMFTVQPAILFTRDITGAEIFETLEKSVAAYPELSPSYKQFGGMRVVADPSREAGSRIVSVTLNDGTPVTADGVYTLAGHDALDNWRADAIEGEDFITGFGTTPEAFVEYIKNGKNLKEKPDGRMQYVKGAKK